MACPTQKGLRNLKTCGNADNNVMNFRPLLSTTITKFGLLTAILSVGNKTPANLMSFYRRSNVVKFRQLWQTDIWRPFEGDNGQQLRRFLIILNAF